MCDQHNFPHPLNNSFYYHYLQQHAALSYHFQKLHNNIQYGIPLLDGNNPANRCPYEDYSSSCSSCSCCSSENCSNASSGGTDEMDEEYEEEDYNEDESECEYEFNVDAILAMRAAKEELKKQEKLELISEKSSDSKDGESSDSNEERGESSHSKDDKLPDLKDDESSDSKDENDSKSDSIVLLDSDKEDFEFIDLKNTKMMDSKLFKNVGKRNKYQEEENRKETLKYLYGSKYDDILRLETGMSLTFEQICDNGQPPLWPVLPLRL